MFTRMAGICALRLAGTRSRLAARSARPAITSANPKKDPAPHSNTEKNQDDWTSSK